MEVNKFRIRAVNRNVDGFKDDSQKEWVEPFLFIQAADPQFGLLADLEKTDERIWTEEIRRAKLAVAVAKKLEPKPKFFIVCGDMIHAFPGHQYRQEQTDDFKKIFSELEPEIPLLCVCGNHDVGQQPTHDTVRDYRNTFGDDYYSFWCGGVLFIVINSQFYQDSTQVEDLAAEQDQWLDKLLAEAKENKCKHSVILQHIPWFLQSPDEDNQYFNLDIEIRKKMLEKFKNSGIGAIFCGHYHRNAGGFYKNMELVVTTAIGAQLGDENPGMRVVTVLEDRIQHQFHELESFPKQINF